MIIQSFTKNSKIFKRIKTFAFVGGVVGASLTFLLFSGSPQKALDYTKQAQDSFGQGLGVMGFFGLMFWNFFVIMTGAVFGALIGALGTMYYYFNRLKNSPQFKAAAGGPSPFARKSHGNIERDADVIDIQIKKDEDQN